MTGRLAGALLLLLPLAAHAQRPAGQVGIIGQIERPASFRIDGPAALLPSIDAPAVHDLVAVEVH